MKRFLLVSFFLGYTIFSSSIKAQNSGSANGLVMGTILDADNSKSVSGAIVSMMLLADSNIRFNHVSLPTGEFIIEKLPFGYYRLRVSSVGYASLTIDSIHIRPERYDFDLNDIRLSKQLRLLNEVMVFAEKPLIESKDGKIIFNTGESALSSGATTTELLKQTPLVNIDHDGKILLRGKEVKVLIDDKPVELDSKQLQDLMESMPGSMIEKIEVMTTPPPQYANERGGVINIITKKGKVGINGKVTVNAGTRREASVNGSLNYRKNKLSLSFNAGIGYSQFRNNSYSYRKNFYADSTNYLNTLGNSQSNNWRPNLRLSIDYDINKQHAFNVTAQYNSNQSQSENTIAYSQLGNLFEVYQLSNRITQTMNNNSSPAFNVTYTLKGKNPKTILKFIGGLQLNSSDNERNFYQQYLNPDYTFNGQDSTQQQLTYSKNNNLNLRLNYDKSFSDNKTSLNVGLGYNRYNNHHVLNSAFMKKPENVFIKNEILSNDFTFHQSIFSLRSSIRYDFITDFYISGGLQAEYTETYFNIINNSNRYLNSYWSVLPFATLVKKWQQDISLTFSYKRTIQRPRLNELNPSLDYADPYNTRSGNPYVQAYYADNFDFIIGKWNKKYNINLSLGYNALQKIYSSIKTLQSDGKTFTTWQNISGRKEYEASVWGGYTFDKKTKANLSFGYTYNVYSAYDRQVRFFRNGGSMFSTLNGSYQVTDLMNANASFTFNRFANPQGLIRNTVSMNLGIQQKFFNKKITVTLNIIDPFRQQQNLNFTYGSNFSLESSSTANTRNYRLTLSYSFKKKEKKTGRDALLQQLKQQ